MFGKDSLESWKKRWRWEYVESPGAEFAEAGMWVAERDDGRILGFQGSFPERLKIRENEISAYDPGDLAVHSDARRQGLGQKLTLAYMDNEEYITMAYGWAAATGRIFQRLGLDSVYCVPRYWRPLNLQSIFYFMLDSKRVPDWISKTPLVSLVSIGCKISSFALNLINYLKSPKKSAKYTVEEVREAGSEFDNLWKELSAKFPIIFVRDAKFIRWRFFNDPAFKHDLLGIRDRDGKLRGYIDIMVAKRGTVFVGRIMDIFCPPEETELVDSVLAKAFEIFKQCKVAFITCVGLHPVIRSRVKRYLYYTPRVPEEPGLLNWKGDAKLKTFVQNADNWHLSHADGDGGFFSLNREVFS